MSRKPELQVPVPRLPPDREDDVRTELEHVLVSPLFRGSRRCQHLLRRITEQTLAGDVESLKERALGIEVFGRPADYDTSQDPVVRVSAAEIRKKLAQYYQEAGHEAELHIDLPSGSYVAEFHFHAPKEAVVTAQPKPRKRYAWIAGTLGAIALAILVFTLFQGSWKRSDLDRLWEPVLKAPGPVLVCVGLQVAYNLRSARAQDEIQGILPQHLDNAATPAIREQDLVLLRDRYVAMDDALCLVRLTSLLERYHKPYRIRAERSLSFADLRDTPAVLIGAFDNPWTLRTGGQLRFTFTKDGEHDTGMVFDRDHPEKTDWKLTNYWPNWDIPFDYAIVTRMLDTTTDRLVVIAAGLTQYGTVGAGEFLTNQEYFAEAVRQFKGDWRKKNLQIVLRVPVVNRTSGHPQVLATHLW